MPRAPTASRAHRPKSRAHALLLPGAGGEEAASRVTYGAARRMRSCARHAARGDPKSRAHRPKSRAHALLLPGAGGGGAQPRANYGAAREMRSCARHRACCQMASSPECARPNTAVMAAGARTRVQEHLWWPRFEPPTDLATGSTTRAPTESRAHRPERSSADCVAAHDKSRPWRVVDVPPEGERGGLSRRGRLTGSAGVADRDGLRQER